MSELNSLEIGRLRIWIQYIESAYMLHQVIKQLTDTLYALPIEERYSGFEQISRLELMFGSCMNRILTTQFPIDDHRAADPDDFDRNFGY